MLKSEYIEIRGVLFTTIFGHGSSRARLPSDTIIDLSLQVIENMREIYFYTQYTNPFDGTWISDSRPLEPAIGRKFHIESEFEVDISYV